MRTLQLSILFWASGELIAQGSCVADQLKNYFAQVNLNESEHAVQLTGIDDATRKLITHNPDATIDRSRGLITVDLARTERELFPALRKLKLVPAREIVWLNGETPFEIAPGQTKVEIPFLPHDRQVDVDVEIRDASGKTIHTTQPTLFENPHAPVVTVDHPSSPTGLKLPESALGGERIDWKLIAESSVREQRGMGWNLRPDATPAFRKAFEKYGFKLQIRLDRRGLQPPTGVKVTAPEIVDGKTREVTIPAKLSDFFFFKSTTFSEHHFYWDGNLGAMFSKDHWLARQHRVFQRYIQDHAGTGAGDMPREVRFNLHSFQRAHEVKLGERRFNSEYVNPPLDGFAEDHLQPWDPGHARESLPNVIKGIEATIHWMETEPDLAIRDADGKLVGFKWTPLGSGRDNRDAVDAYVDHLAFYLMNIEQAQRFHLMLGENAEAAKLGEKAAGVRVLLNSRYWSEKQGVYVDLLKDPKTGQLTKTDTTDHLNATVFWTGLTDAVPKDRMDRMAAVMFDPQKFYGRFFRSVSAKSPSFHPEGHYWQGSGWPPDAIMATDTLLAHGRRVEARKFALRQLSAATEASNAYKLGYTPKHVVDGTAPDNVGTQLQDPKVLAAIEPRSGTTWENLGMHRDKNGVEFVGWGVEIRADKSLHITRGEGDGKHDAPGFNWADSQVAQAARAAFGIEAVAAYHGPASGRFDWMRAQFGPLFKRHETAANPELAPLANYLSSHPQATDADLAGFLDSQPAQGKAIRNQIAAASSGYVEVSPTYDPGSGETVIAHQNYNGTWFTLHVDRLGGDNEVRLTVESDQPIPLQFNRHWSGNAASDLAYASSPIVMVGGAGARKSVTLKLTSATTASK